MRNFIAIIAFSLFGFACDFNEQDGRIGHSHRNNDIKIAEELATDLKLCTEEKAAQDAVECARDLLSDLEEVSPRCGDDPPAPPPVPKCVKKGNALICPTQSPEP